MRWSGLCSGVVFFSAYIDRHIWALAPPTHRVLIVCYFLGAKRPQGGCELGGHRTLFVGAKRPQGGCELGGLRTLDV